MGTPSYIPTWNCTSSGGGGFTSPHTRGRSLCCWLLCTGKLEAMKQSPPRAATPNLSVVSPKTKCSSGQGSPHHGSGCSSNTSTPKCPDSTSTKKPSSSKEPTLNSQEKSPKARGSCKHGCSPSPSTESVRCKWKDVLLQGTSTRKFRAADS